MTVILALLSGWLKTVFQFFTTPIGQIVGAALIAVAVYFAGHWRGYDAGDAAATARLQPQIDKLNSGLATCRGNVSTLTGSLDRQNAAVAALQAEGVNLQAAADKAVEDSRKAIAAANKKAGQILNQQAKPGESACEAAERVINDAVAP